MSYSSVPNRRWTSILLVVLLVLALFMASYFSIANAAPGKSVAADVNDSPDTVKTSHRLIVQLSSPALAELESVARTPDGRINLASSTAQAYVAQLQAEQAAFVSQMSQALPDAAVASYINEAGQNVEATYQIVFNGVAVDPGATDTAEARRALAAVPGVKAVYLDFAHQPDLYASLPLINAPDIWAEVGGQTSAGAGIKFASMDGGLHHAAPMFDGTGWSYPPGWPAGGLGDSANNNGKIIASRAYFRAWDPPSPGDENTWPGTQGTSHGTHTGSTAVGNPVTANYLGLEEDISGVAPGAWAMSYRVFYNSVTNDGSFYDVEGIAALEDIVQDGADVVNNSWGGGPGSVGGEFDAIDAALLNTYNAGVFVSMSAGNAGPGLGTGDHPSDEYINVAASTTDGTLASGRLNIILPEPISPTLQGISYAAASFGAPLPAGTAISYTYVTAMSVDPGNVEGCNPWPAGTFTGNAAVISRGTCEFGVKVLNAEQAGAEFVVVYNHATGGEELISMGPGAVGNQVTISSIFVGHSAGVGMVSWYDQNGSASTLEVDTHAFQVGNTPDQIIAFSSRGPSAAMTLKPDIAAPGVNILAQGYDPTATGEARHLGFGQASGTSMASPHVAGSAVILRQIHPDWSNAEIKSALMSTSKFMDIYNYDGTPAQPLDMGAGRLDLANASDPGVILDPPSVSFGLVDADGSGTVNVTVTSVATDTETYNLSTLYTGNGFAITQTTTLTGFTVMPASITLDPGESETISVTFDAATSQGMGDNQGYILLEGDGGHNAHMATWARVLAAPTGADVLILDNDASSSVGAPDYIDYYTMTLQTLGMTYDIYDADANYGNDITIPSLAELAQYKAILYYSGDNYQPDGTFTVATPLTALDMDILNEYANTGGILIAMGQDLASVWSSTDPDSATFLYASTLGGEYLQDSVTDFELPTLPILPAAQAPPAFDDVRLDLSDAAGADGAMNQYYIDEIVTRPNWQPDGQDGKAYPYAALLYYPGPYNVEDGTVAMAHREQPNLEYPGVSYDGRSIYTTFGLEGVNDLAGFTSRAELMSLFMDWAMDEPQATIVNTTDMYSDTTIITTFSVDFSSNISGTTGVTYRWDFGDGTPYTNAYTSNVASHSYDVCGNYTVRVEVVDSLGNSVVASENVPVGNCASYIIYLPIAAKAEE